MKIAMTNSTRHSYTDAVIDGLLAGLAAGAGMLAFLLLTGLLTGEPLMSVISRFSPNGENLQPLAGVLLHLGVSSIYGVMYGVLLHSLSGKQLNRVPGWLMGLIFGLILFLLAYFVLLPGNGSALLELPAWQFAVAHLVYGVTAGILYARKSL
jgi:hypothetical protein